MGWRIIRFYPECFIKLPDGITAPYRIGQSLSITWKEMEWLISFAKIPVLLKGILNPDAAKDRAEEKAAKIAEAEELGPPELSFPITVAEI